VGHGSAATAAARPRGGRVRTAGTWVGKRTRRRLSACGCGQPRPWPALGPRRVGRGRERVRKSIRLLCFSPMSSAARLAGGTAQRKVRRHARVCCDTRPDASAPLPRTARPTAGATPAIADCPPRPRRPSTPPTVERVAAASFAATAATAGAAARRRHRCARPGGGRAPPSPAHAPAVDPAARGRRARADGGRALRRRPAPLPCGRRAAGVEADVGRGASGAAEAG